MEEANKIAELREKFVKKFVEPPTPRLSKFDPRDVMRIKNDDLYALSFIHWKKDVVDNAVEMVADVLEWRAENKTTDMSVENIGVDFFRKGFCYVHGRDLGGKRVMVLVGRMQTKDEREQTKKVFTFWLERLQRNEPGQHVTFILDTYKTAMSNVDLGLIRYIIDSFTTNFPDLLERIIILDMPWIMNAIWNIVKQWMSEEQRSKTAFCSRKDLKKYIAADQLPEDMGGTSPWKYDFPPFPDDLKPDQDFKNDPMNFTKTEGDVDIELIPSTPSEAENHLANGSVVVSAEDNFNNNHQEQNGIDLHQLRENVKLLPEKRKQEIPQNELPSIPSTSGLNQGTAETPKNVVSTKDAKKRITRSQSSNLAKVRKTGSFDEMNGLDDSTMAEADKYPRLRRHNTADAPIQDRTQANVSFKSLKGDERDASAGDLPRTESKAKISVDEIKLGNLLVMSPVSELVFSQDTSDQSKLRGFMNVRNPNLKENEEGVIVAFKVKTTSPERYHVKPSIGIIKPGETSQIRIHLGPGYDTGASRDRFLLIYKRFPVADDQTPTHGEIVKFWRQNSDKSSHSEHRLRVRFDGNVPPSVPKSSAGIGMGEIQRPGSPTSLASFLSQEKPMQESEFTQLQQQVSILNNKLTRLESDSRWMRRRMRHAMVLLTILIFLLALLLYELATLQISLTSSMQVSRQATPNPPYTFPDK